MDWQIGHVLRPPRCIVSTRWPAPGRASPGCAGGVAAVPPPLAIGTLLLEDGTAAFLCEAHAAAGADDISRYGGWRAYLAGWEGRDG
jgi:hypothetical protein